MENRDRGGCILTVIIIVSIALLVGGGLGGVMFLRYRSRQQVLIAREQQMAAMQRQMQQLMQAEAGEAAAAALERLSLAPAALCEARAAAAQTAGLHALVHEPLQDLELQSEPGRARLVLTGAADQTLSLTMDLGQVPAQRQLLCEGEALEPGSPRSRDLYGLLARWYQRVAAQVNPRHAPGDVRLLEFFELLEAREFEASAAETEPEAEAP